MTSGIQNRRVLAIPHLTLQAIQSRILLAIRRVRVILQVTQYLTHHLILFLILLVTRPVIRFHIHLRILQVRVRVQATHRATHRAIHRAILRLHHILLLIPYLILLLTRLATHRLIHQVLLIQYRIHLAIPQVILRLTLLAHRIHLVVGFYLRIQQISYGWIRMTSCGKKYPLHRILLATRSVIHQATPQVTQYHILRVTHQVQAIRQVTQ